MRERISELEATAEIERVQPPKGTEQLHQGDDTFEIKHTFDARTASATYPYYEETSYTATITPTWNEIFGAVAPSMISEISERELNQLFIRFFQSYSKNSFSTNKDVKEKELRDFVFKNEDLDTCLVQLRALWLIKESVRQRSVKDTRTYWKLTPYGDHVMVQLRALRHDTTENEQSGKASPIEKVKKQPRNRVI